MDDSFEELSAMSEANSNPKNTLQVISNATEFLKLEHDWNTLVNQSCTSPFLLSGFVKQLMDSTRSNEWKPLLLIFSMNGNVVGFVPLATKKKFGIRSAKFLHVFTHQPDFIVLDQHREIFIEHTLGFLFRDLNCKFVDFSMDANSPNLQIIERYCRNERINFSVAPEMGHNVIPVDVSWTDFESLRGRNFRKQFKKMKSNFDSAGSWKIVCTKGNNSLEAIKKILAVERQSWKEEWRTQRDENVDPNLKLVLEGAQHTAKVDPNFAWKVYFLELNEQALAYFLVFQYKETALLLKTSYDQRYKNLSPGSFLHYGVIRKIFEAESVKTIDFVTDLRYHRRWTSVCIPRVRAMLTDGTLPKTWKQIFDCPPLSKVVWLAKSSLDLFEQLSKRLQKTGR